MVDPKNTASQASATEVEAPHPGSVPNATPIAASDRKPPRPHKSSAESRPKPEVLPLTENRTRINTEAPRHPTKSASAS